MAAPLPATHRRPGHIIAPTRLSIIPFRKRKQTTAFRRRLTRSWAIIRVVQMVSPRSARFRARHTEAPAYSISIFHWAASQELNVEPVGPVAITGLWLRFPHP